MAPYLIFTLSRNESETSQQTYLFKVNNTKTLEKGMKYAQS